MRKQIFIIILLTITISAVSKTYKLCSPDGKLIGLVSTGEFTTFSLASDKQLIIKNALISIDLKNGITWGKATSLCKVKRENVRNNIASPLYKRNKVKDYYNSLTVICKDYNIEFRMYDDGMAYRFIGHSSDSITIDNEQSEVNFAKDFKAYVPYIINRSKKAGTPLEEQWWNDQQCRFITCKLSEINPNNLVALPFTVELEYGEKLCMIEADQECYPGIYLLKDKGTCSMKAVFPAYPQTLMRGGHGNIEMLVKERESYIAKTDGTRAFPWRAYIISKTDGQLVESDMVYRLASPCRLKDISWIKPGKATWDWWNNIALSGINFKAGFNNRTYKYFIDFAHDFKLEYVLIDEGWFSTKSTDIYDIVPDINLKELVEYANSKNVGIILWTGYLSIARDLKNAVKHYADMGIKGFKIDFLNRDDQQMMQFMKKMAETCAHHHLIVDFHGTCKPSGMQRTYPNVLNYEAVFGLEQMRWSDKSVDMVTHDVILPFTRMVAGPMDYTPGAMTNSLKGMYAPNKRNPMSQGTRMHQVAMYICYDSPLNMLSDSPTKYQKDKPCTEFIASIPTIWDETKVLDAKVGEYIVTARKSGDQWFIGAMNNWKERTINITLPDECRGKIASIMCDGLNADRVAEDYKIENTTIAEDGIIKIHMAEGGGWALRTE